MFDDLIGKSYQEVGRCYGLCRIVCSRLNIDLPPLGDFEPGTELQEIEKRVHLFGGVEAGSERPGDLIHIRGLNGEIHVGVIIKRNTLMQVVRNHRVHLMRLNDIWIRSRIVGIYRYAG